MHTHRRSPFLLLAVILALACSRRPTPSSNDPPSTTPSAPQVAVEQRTAPGTSWVSGTRIRVTVHAARDRVAGAWGAPPAGTKYVALDLQFENDRGPAAYSLPTLLAFYRLKSADGREYLPNWMLQTAQPSLQPGAIGAGDTKRGWVSYQVPEELDLTSLRFQYEFERRATDWIPLGAVIKQPAPSTSGALSKKPK